MISNIQTTEEYTTEQGWVRIIKYDAYGVSNTIQCKGLDNYSSLLDKLVSSQICEKKVPYHRVKYVKGKNK